MTEKFSFKETIKRNVRFLLRFLISFVLFMIGMKAISRSTDQFVILFLTLTWCYIFLKNLKVRPRVIYKSKEGDLIEY